MKRPAFVVAILALILVATCAVNAAEVEASRIDHVAVQSNDSGLLLEFNVADIDQQIVELNSESFTAFTAPGEGITYDYGKPILPMVSRFVVVPPNVAIELVVESGDVQVIPAESPPPMNLDEELAAYLEVDEPEPLQGVYPETIAEMSIPTIMRGVRMVKITTHPVQYDSENNVYLYHENIRTELRYTNDAPVNAVRNPVRRNKSREFQNVINNLVVNPSEPSRDDIENLSPYAGHMLVACHENAILHAQPFLEWRRKSGYKVDIMSVSSGQGGNINTVRGMIQDRYDEYVDAGEDPFDHLLIIGDYTGYDGKGPAQQWIINTNTGESIWGSPAHADYYYGLLEGDDIHMDVGLSRWTSGNATTMGLFVERSLAYEARPYMEDTDWFTRGAVGSQHWGNSETGHWHQSIHSTVRWGLEVLEHLGYDDIRFHERYEHDREGQSYGPWATEQYDDGCNVMIERAENYYWRNNFNGPRDNVIFPIRLVTSGHGEWATWWSTRSGSAQHPRGPVASTCGWGGPSITAMNAVWLGMVKGIMLNDMSFGWGWVYSTVNLESFLPNFRYGSGSRDIYHQTKTDTDTYGDPTIKPWRNVPREVDVDHPVAISDATRMIEVFVFDPAIEDLDEAAVGDARVTLYVPGELPDDADDYAEHEVWQVTTFADLDGYARFVFNEAPDWDGDLMYVTVTGRDSEGKDLLPNFSEIEIERNVASIDLANYEMNETEGNEDGDVNPGETFSLSLSALNLAAEGTIEDVTAVVSSLSPWIEIAEDNEVTFGDLEADEATDGQSTVEIIIHPACPDGAARPSTKPQVLVEFHAGEDVWRSGFTIDPVAPNFSVRRIPGGIVIADTLTEINIDLENTGRLDSPPITAHLVNLGMGVGVVESNGIYDALDAGHHSTLRDDGTFLISGNSVVVPGSMTQMMLILTNENDFVDTSYFDLQVREEDENFPQGPDKYGYICFDCEDEDWAISPDYEWVEISLEDRDRDEDGEVLDFDRNPRGTEEVGQTIVIPMPFSMQFYGYMYDTITVCTNGFVSMGNQPMMHNSQNWPLDQAFAGGLGMVAPFWDWLQLGQNGDVYTYYDEDDSRYIIEWYRFRHKETGQADLTFQVILYDNSVWVTESGDQNILFQYKSIAQAIGPHDEPNNDAWAVNVPYASVGISSPNGDTGLNYTFANTYPVTSTPLRNQLAILYSTSPQYKSCLLYGTVTDFANDAPITGAVVATKHGFTALTDENGEYRINGALAEVPFDITARAQGFNDSTEFGLEVPEGDSLEINFQLLHPEFTPSVWNLFQRLDPGFEVPRNFQMQNTGNGPMFWNVDRRLLGDANANPWEIRRQYASSDSLNDARLQGVVFVEDNFYITGYNGGEPQIYVVDREGNLVRQFDQLNSSHYGMKDLTWDGQWLWGSGEKDVIAFNRDGEEMARFEGPQSVNTLVTWDTDRQCLWISSTTTDIVSYDLEGNRLNSINRDGFRMYGLSYYPDDPDNHPLYILHKVTDYGDMVVHKMNPETNDDTMFVADLIPPEGGVSGGTFITNTFDVYSWVYMIAVNDGSTDRIDIWQVDARKDWFQLDMMTDIGWTEAEAGTLQTGEITEFLVTLNSTELPETTFVSELYFTHNADSGLGHVGIELDVIGPMQPVPFDLAYPANLDTLSFDSSLVTFTWDPTEDWNINDDPFYVFWICVQNDSIGIATHDTSMAIDLDTLAFNRERMYDHHTTWWVKAMSGEDVIECNERYGFLMDPDAGLNESSTIPVEFTIESIYPSPFNSSTRIRFGIDQSDQTQMTLYDVMGRQVAVLYNGVPEVGWHTVTLDGSMLSSGIYWVKLQSGNRTKIAKTTMIK